MNSLTPDPSVKRTYVKAYCRNCSLAYYFYDISAEDVVNNTIDCGCGVKTCPRSAFLYEEKERLT